MKDKNGSWKEDTSYSFCMFVYVIFGQIKYRDLEQHNHRWHVQ